MVMAIKLISLIWIITLSFDMTEGLGFDQPFVKNYGHFGRSTPEPKNFYLKWRQMLVNNKLYINKYNNTSLFY